MAEIVDARDRFPGPDVPVAIPMDPHDVVELARLRQIERNLQRPIIHLLRVVAAAEVLTDKAQQHKTRGYEHIKVGALDQLTQAVQAMRETRGQL